MNTSKLLVSMVLSLLLFAQSNCEPPGLPPETPSNFGRAQVQALITDTQASDIDRVAITITGPGIAPPIESDLVFVNGVWTGVIPHIPAGENRLFTAEAYQGTEIIFSGQTTLTIVQGQTTVVPLVLNQTGPADSYTNEAPIIESVTASTGILAPSATVDLVAVATDGDGDPLVYAWTASSGSFDDASVATPVFTAPATDGTVTITLWVTDPKGAADNKSFSLIVQTPPSEGDGYVSIEVNSIPDITAMTSNPASVEQDSTTQVAVTASDADADTLSYAWTTTCAGSLDDASVANPILSVDGAATLGPCDLDVTVSDGRGAFRFGTLTITIIEASPVNIPPLITDVFYSAPSVVAGEDLLLEITAVDDTQPSGIPLTFAWAAGIGNLGPQTDTDTTSSLTFTAPDCTGTVDVVVTVTDAGGLVAQYTFTTEVTGGSGACLTPVEGVDLIITRVDVATNVTISGPFGVQVPVTVEVTNNGTEDAAWGSLYNWVALSTDTDFDNTAAWLGQGSGYNPAGTIPAGGTMEQTFNLPLTKTVPSGDYNILVVTNRFDYASEVNLDNNSFAPQTLTITNNNTTVSLVSATLSATTITADNPTFDVTYTLENTGDAPTGYSYVRYFMYTDTDTSQSKSTVEMGALGHLHNQNNTNVPTLQPGEQFTHTETIVLPATLGADTYHLQLDVNLTNNIGTDSIRPFVSTPFVYETPGFVRYYLGTVPNNASCTSGGSLNFYIDVADGYSNAETTYLYNYSDSSGSDYSRTGAYVNLRSGGTYTVRVVSVGIQGYSIYWGASDLRTVTSTGTPDCAGDSYEPNDTAAAATPLFLETIQDHTVSAPNNNDYFTITVP